MFARVDETLLSFEMQNLSFQASALLLLELWSISNILLVGSKHGRCVDLCNFPHDHILLSQLSMKEGPELI
jgi:hypothetical protein